MEAFRATFAELRDPRDQNAWHDFFEMLFIAISAIASGAQNCVEIAEFAKAKKELLSGLLVLKHGAPSHDTFSRLFRRLDSAIFKKCFARFAAALQERLLKSKQQDNTDKVLAVDGKSSRGSFDKISHPTIKMMVSAWCEQTGLTVAHTIAKGGDEVDGALELFDIISLKGYIVTADALHGHKKMAKKIIDSGSDYVLSVKRNHPELYREMETKLRKGEATATWSETFEHSHGRLEWRRAMVVPAEELVDKYEFTGLKAIARIDDMRMVNGKTETRTRLFVLSEIYSSKRVLKLVRSHWSIENKCHWVLDMILNEDYSRTRKENGPENLSLIRRIVMNVWKSVPHKGSLAVKRKRAGWNDACFLEMITHLR